MTTSVTDNSLWGNEVGDEALTSALRSQVMKRQVN